MEREMDVNKMALKTPLESLHHPSGLHCTTRSKGHDGYTFSDCLRQEYSSERFSKSLRSSFVEDNYQTTGSSGSQESWEVRWEACYGRYLVASRDIVTGEVIFQEEPLLVVPKAGSEPACLACLKTLYHEKCWCSLCGAPLCSPGCPGGSHGVQECSLLSRLGFGAAPLSEVDVRDLNALLGPLRALLLIEESSAAKEAFFALQSHKERRLKLPIGRFVDEHIVKKFKTRLGLDVDPEVIRHLCGVLDTNAFEVGLENGSRGRAVFVKASLLNHSCLPNAQRWFLQGKMTLRASLDIPKGAPILINYTQALWGTHARATHLSRCKMFTCKCKRCLDPMELGSHMSSVACRECQGFMVPPNDPQSPWQCQTCGTGVNASAIEAMVKAGAVALSHLTSGDLHELTSSLSHLSRMLGHTHYIVAKVKYALVQAVMNHPLKDVDSADLVRVVYLTRELLQLAACIEPGLTRFRGLILYDQTRALAELIDRCRYSGSETNPEVRSTVFRDLIASYSVETTTSPLQTLLYHAAECEYILQYDTRLQEVTELTRRLRQLIEVDDGDCTRHIEDFEDSKTNHSLK